jgi:hypothetical protein
MGFVLAARLKKFVLVRRTAAVFQYWYWFRWAHDRGNYCREAIGFLAGNLAKSGNKRNSRSKSLGSFVHNPLILLQVALPKATSNRELQLAALKIIAMILDGVLRVA